MRAIGSSIPRGDARDKVTGAAQYPGDLAMDGMLHAVTLLARRPHARVTRLDVSAAEKAPGVVRVFTSVDVPRNRFIFASRRNGVRSQEPNSRLRGRPRASVARAISGGAR